MSDGDFGNNSMLDMYLFESTELLNQLDDILLDSEKSSSLSPENINEIFRIMHTIKGSSAMMEFNTISFVSHRLEDLFYIIRDKGINEEYFPDLFDLVLNVSDFLKEEVEKIQSGETLVESNDELVADIMDFIERLKSEDGEASEEAPAVAEAAAPAAPAEAAAPAAPAEAAAPAAAADGKARYICAHFKKLCQMENLRASMLVEKIKPLVEVIAMLPPNLDDAEASEPIVENGFYCSFTSDSADEEIIKAAMTAPSVDTVEFVSGFPTAAAAAEPAKPKETEAAPKPAAAPAAPKPAAKPAAAPSKPAAKDTKDAKHPDGKGGDKAPKQNLINVDLNKLDALMDLVGEIVITESMVSGNAVVAGLNNEAFNKAARQLRKLTDELQDTVMSVRMVPIAGTFQKMKRIVRDMGKKLDKDVELILVGESTEVDKTIIDAIGDPIMHLVRNAMDHAIEDKTGRVAAMKDPMGKITLSAQNLGGNIIIAVSDDGKGLDTEFILGKAKSKGLLTKPESDYTEKEIFNLLMMPGFSTKEAVTEFSGRGVGMDVVKKNIEKIGGTVTIDSIKGTGTTIYFKIPLTLAIISSMEIRVGKNIYTVPIANIRESFKATTPQLLTDPDGNEMIMIRGVCYPIIRLHEIFHVEDGIKTIEDGILLLVDSGDRLACLLADELIGKQQVVVKPLPNYLARFASKGSGISGCTVMGDGSISLILDTQGILNQH
ncbi:MAG: chemotaxis protein CheA [Clostridia bacterium]|nr:chemotaxis protein CheA [Clostridia bacterium]